MRLPLRFILCVVVLLSACTPAQQIAPTIAATAVSPAPTATIPPTLVPSAVIQVQTLLSDFPGDNYCKLGALIPAGTEVDVLGAYQDYVAVAWNDGAGRKQGFIPKAKLAAMLQDIPQLSADAVPWQPLLDFSTWTYYSPDNGGELVIQPASEEQSDWAVDPGHHPVQVPLRMHFGLQRTYENWAGVRIYGTSDVATPWWKGINRMDVTVDRAHYRLCVRDGSSEGCTADIPLTVTADQELTLQFMDENGKRLQVLDQDNNVLQEIDLTKLGGLNLPNGLFPEGWFQFGTTVGAPEKFRVIHPSVTTLPKGTYQPSWLEAPGLKDLAATHGIQIGTEFNPDQLVDARLCAVYKHDYNVAIISAFSDPKLWTGPGQYDFVTLDQIVNQTAQLGVTLYASHLVWGTSDEEGGIPAWIRNGNYSKDQLLDILHQHITTLMTRYRGKVKIYSIANEAPQRDRYPGADFWFDHIGSEYIDKAFQWAREADPDAILILNTDNNESPRDADTSYNIDVQYRIAKRLKDKGILDAVGMQMHLFLPWNSRVAPKEADVEATMKKFGDLGVQVMITEMDVNQHEMSGAPEQRAALQKQLYADMMTACIHSRVCTLFATWGISDATSWVAARDIQAVYPTYTPDAAPLLFDVDYNPKPPYFALIQVLSGP